MVDDQIEARDVTDPNVLTAMRSVPRHFFVPDSYEDRPTATTRSPSATARRSLSPTSSP